MDFKQKLTTISEANNSLLCVGLDIDKEKIPSHLFQTEENPFLAFNKQIIDATHDLVCSYKLNMAFYEALGKEGAELLSATIEYIPQKIPVILDGKRNDIGNTAKKYAETLFHVLKGDAATVNPYLGLDGLTPFLDYQEKCIFILCRTSNPSASDFQDLIIQDTKKSLYQLVAKKAAEWNQTYGNCALVVGATCPAELKEVRDIVGDTMPLLIPGVGKQGGDIAAAVKNGTNSDGQLAIINSSRGIIYAASGEDFAEAARKQAVSLKEAINQHR